MINEANLGQNDEFCAPLIWASNERTCPTRHLKWLGCYIPLTNPERPQISKKGCYIDTESPPIK